jgi:transcriptional adapter 2-alpha
MLGEECDYCVSCFANLDEYPPQYHVINKLDYPLYDNEWNAEEELLLFEGLEK